MWIASAAFVLYGTTIPFSFVFDRQIALEHFARVNLSPLISPDTGFRVSRTDFISNVLLFTPFGAFGVWAGDRQRSAIGRIVWVTFLGIALSVCVEALQLFTIDRTSSTADVLANSLGAISGAVTAVVLRGTERTFLATQRARRVVGARSFYPLLIAASLLCAAAWEPFDVTLDVGSVVPKARTFVRDPWQIGPLSDEVLSATQHLLFAAMLVIWLQEIGAKRPVLTAGIVGSGVAIGLEAAQLFIAARMPGLSDAAVGIAGSLCGLAVASAFPKIRRPVAWCAALFVATAIGAAMQQLSPFVLSNERQPFQWLPFFNYYYAFTNSELVSHSAELLLAYFPLGFGVALTIRERHTRTIVVLLLALAIAAPVEWAQRFIGGRYPDVTDIALSVAGAWLGLWAATEGWRRFDAERVLTSPR
jgi:VanZ family protein